MVWTKAVSHNQIHKMWSILGSSVPGHSVFVLFKGYCRSLAYCVEEGTAKNVSLGNPFAFPWEKIQIEFMGEDRKWVLEMYYGIYKKKNTLQRVTVWGRC